MGRAFALLGVVALTGCGGAPEEAVERPGVRGALGAGAKVTTLARAPLPARPAGPVAWVADELRLTPGRSHEHGHEPGFVYARNGAMTLVVGAGGQEMRLEEGRGAFVSGETHVHAAADGPALMWEIRLAPADAPPPANARRVFKSDLLEGIPTQAEASFLEVSVPARGGETTVHTHPGPEFIYELTGRIKYQNALIGTRDLGPGGGEAIPPDTAVQKRNPYRTDATFLSWFLVDPDAPFAPPARF